MHKGPASQKLNSISQTSSKSLFQFKSCRLVMQTHKALLSPTFGAGHPREGILLIGNGGHKKVVASFAVQRQVERRKSNFTLPLLRRLMSCSLKHQRETFFRVASKHLNTSQGRPNCQSSFWVPAGLWGLLLLAPWSWRGCETNCRK